MDNLLHVFLIKLGLTPEEVLIYQTLVSRGPLSVLQVSRGVAINRTRVYRCLETLKGKGVIEEVVDEHRRLVKAAGAHVLERLVHEQEVKAAGLRQAFPDVAGLLSQQEAQDSFARVQYYKGADGMRQMVWNTLRTKKELLAYTYITGDEVGGEKLGTRWQDEWIKRGLLFRELYSDAYITNLQKQTASKTRIKQQKSPNFVSRYIPSAMLDIRHQVDIYNDVVAYYYWDNDEIFGVEIHSRRIADMQRQLFEMAWGIAGRTAR